MCEFTVLRNNMELNDFGFVAFSFFGLMGLFLRSNQ